jgi:hypothetical protein
MLEPAADDPLIKTYLKDIQHLKDQYRGEALNRFFSHDETDERELRVRTSSRNRESHCQDYPRVLFAKFCHSTQPWRRQPEKLAALAACVL